MVPPTTGSPGVFSTGRDSPVTMDSSRLERPSMIRPSTGTCSPGRTTTTSPTTTSSTGTSLTSSLRTTRARRGARRIRRLMASEVRPLARPSSHRPRSRITMIAPAVSK